jgi:hypothetical protein
MTFDKEAVYIAFPFAGKDPRVAYEVGGAVVRPNEDQWPGGCRDWFSIQRWLTVHTDQGAVAWSAPDTPLIQLCDIQAGKWLDELPITNGTVLAYVMNNYWFTNYKAGQDGRFTFHYSITSSDEIVPAAASVFGASVQQPLAAIRFDGGGSTRQASFCEVAVGAELSCAKTAEDGNGIILRIHDTSGAAHTVEVSAHLPKLSGRSLCDLVERPAGGKATGEMKLNAYGTQTLRVSKSQ